MSARIVCIRQVRNEVTHDEKIQLKSIVERPTTTELFGGRDRWLFIEIGSVQMIRSIWDCPCRGRSRSMYESDDTSGAGVNSIGRNKENRVRKQIVERLEAGRVRDGRFATAPGSGPVSSTCRGLVAVSSRSSASSVRDGSMSLCRRHGVLQTGTKCASSKICFGIRRNA